MPANLENSAVATRLEEVSFHSNPKKGHAMVITEFWGEPDWRQITFYFVMNSVWKGIKLVIVLKMLYFAYKANTLSKSTCVCRFLHYCRKVFTDFFKCLCIWSIWLQIIQVLYNITEKAMAPHSSTLAWKIPWMEEPGRLQSMGSLRVRHDWATSLSLFTFMHWRRKWQPTPVFLPGESQGQGSLVGCHLGVTQSRTRLKWLSIA